MAAFQPVLDVEGVNALFRKAFPGADPAQVVGIARPLFPSAVTADDFVAAVAHAGAIGVTRTYICGSIYLCGAALDANGERVE